MTINYRRAAQNKQARRFFRGADVMARLDAPQFNRYGTIVDTAIEVFGITGNLEATAEIVNDRLSDVLNGCSVTSDDVKHWITPRELRPHEQKPEEEFERTAKGRRKIKLDDKRNEERWSDNVERIKAQRDAGTYVIWGD